MKYPMKSGAQSHWYYIVFVALTLAVSTVIAYWQLNYNSFISFDDKFYIIENPMLHKGLTWETLRWSFSFSHIISYWHPLTWLSLLLDYELFGLNPVGYHRVSLILHIFNALLLFFIFNRLTKRILPSAFVAFLFALHPLNVESVAWAVERKTTLSSLFFMLTIWAYLRYSARPGLKRFLPVFILMALGLMSKSMLVTLPFILLLLDYWPLGRLRLGSTEHTISTRGSTEGVAFSASVPFQRLLLEKLPLLALSVSSVLVSSLSLRGSFTSTDQIGFSLVNRISNALLSYVAYVWKMLWPAKLAVFYPLQSNFPLWQVAVAVLLLTGVSAIAISRAKTWPWLLVGWLWYLGMLFPVSGILQAGKWPAMADRFAYLPLIGIYIIITWGGVTLSERWKFGRTVLACIAGVILVALIICTNIQTGKWKSSVSLYEHAIRVTKNNLLIYANLGQEYFNEGSYEKAFALFTESAGSNHTGSDKELYSGYEKNKQYFPDTVRGIVKQLVKQEDLIVGQYLLGKVYENLNGYVEAVECYNVASAYPETSSVAVYQKRARYDANRLLSLLAPGINRTNTLLDNNPLDVTARWDLATKLSRLGLLDESLKHYLELEKNGVKNWQLFYNIANIYKKQDNKEHAVLYYKKSLLYNPANPETHNNLGVIYKQKKQTPQAIEAFKQAIASDSKYSLAVFNLAMTYFESNDTVNALRYFKLIQDKFPQYNSRVMPYMNRLEKK